MCIHYLFTIIYTHRVILNRRPARSNVVDFLLFFACHWRQSFPFPRMKSYENYRVSRIWYLSPVDGENRKFPISVARVECERWCVHGVTGPPYCPSTHVHRRLFLRLFSLREKYLRHTDTKMSDVISVAGAKTGGLRRVQHEPVLLLLLEYPTHNKLYLYTPM